MKTKILFVIESLICGGAEKSLTTLLNLIDYNRFEVYLQLFTFKGEFMRYIPKEVNLLPLLPSTQIEGMSIMSQLLSGKFGAMVAHIKFSYKVRRIKNSNCNDVFTLYWKTYGKLITPNPTYYDVAIAYGQRLPTFYVAKKVNARKKFAWINIIPQLEENNRQFQKPIYDYFNKIVCVSEASRQKSIELFELPKERTHIATDITDSTMIERLAKEKPEFRIDTAKPAILTVARLDYVCKGYDIALEAAKILRDRGVDFVWYSIGKGEKYNEMLNYISEHNLHKNFVLLGSTPNPYPYYNMCDVYVQPSRYEGYGMAISEARLLNVPVVCCEFGCVWKQIIQGKNGIVTSHNPADLADAIQELLLDKKKYNYIKSNLMKEKKGNSEEIENIYRLIQD